MKNLTLPIALLLIVLLPATTFAGKLYRWKDEHGNWILSDKVPPEEAVHERSELNEEGRTIKIHEAAKTPEQIEQEELLKQLQKDKKRLLIEQQKEDEVLLKTFQREEDIELALNAKIKTLDSRKKLATDQMSQQQHQLLAQQKKAAGFERDGKPIPKNVMSEIHATERVIQDYEHELVEIEHQKSQLQARSEKDKARFALLKQYGNQKITIQDVGVPCLRVGRIPCPNPAACDRLWPQAMAYAKQAGNTRILMEGDHFLLTAPPTTSDDLSLSLARIDNGSNTTLYLDIRCKDSEPGRKACRGEPAYQVIDGFNALPENSSQ